MLRVLVVEDDAAIRLLVDRVLTGAGHLVQTAPNAREATAWILYDLPQVPDVALLDIVLPETSGLEYAETLRQHFPSIRIVFMTGWPEGEGRHEEASRLGAVLLKPFNRDALLAAIEQTGPAERLDDASRGGPPGA